MTVGERFYREFTAPRWVRRLPAVSGYYWLRVARTAAAADYTGVVFVDAGAELVTAPGRTKAVPLADPLLAGASWCGPLDPPEEG